MTDLSLAILVTGVVIVAPIAAASPSPGAASGLADAEFTEPEVMDGPLRWGTHSPNSTTAGGNASTDSPAENTPEATASMDAAGHPVNETEPPANDTTTAGPPANVSPGGALSGVVSAQGAEVESDVDERTFERRLNASSGNHSKAVAIAGRQGVLEDRMAALRNRSRALEAAHENGSIGESRYRAAVTGMTARAMALQRQANRTDNVARDLPREALAAAGVNTSAMETLRNASRELSGPETRRIAHSIAGRDVGQSVAEERRPDHAGPPDERGREGEAGDEQRGNRGDSGSGEEQRGNRDEGSASDEPAGSENATQNSDRGSQNASDDRSDRGDRGRSDTRGGSDQSSGDGEPAESRSGDGEGDAGERDGNGDRNDAGDDGGAEEKSEAAEGKSGGGADGRDGSNERDESDGRDASDGAENGDRDSAPGSSGDGGQ